MSSLSPACQRSCDNRSQSAVIAEPPHDVDCSLGCTDRVTAPRPCHPSANRCRAISVLLLLLSGLALLSACAQPQLATPPAPVTLYLAGSTSMQPLLRDLAAAYSKRYSHVSFDFAAMGSTAGLEALRRGSADLALVSRELQPDEEYDALSGKDLLAYVTIAQDAIAIIVNERNPIRALSLHELRRVFAGQVSRWDEIGGSATEVSVVSREDGSATRAIFEERLMNGRMVTRAALVMPGSQTVCDYVATHEGAIGYVSIGYLSPGIVALAVEGVAPDKETIENGSYAITRPFLLVSTPTPKGEVTAFLQFVRSPAGQAIVQRTYGRASTGTRR